MPIRFRCVYCDQLLGIAHRKAGTVVKCPNCAGQLIVPSPDVGEDASNPDLPTASAGTAGARPVATQQDKTAPAPAAAPPIDGPGLLFERNDFDELLKPALERREPAVATSPRPTRRPPPALAPAPAPMPGAPAPAAAFDFTNAPAAPVEAAPAVVPALAPARRSGILLTPIKLILLTLLVMFGMGFAFAGGMLLGWYLHR